MPNEEEVALGGNAMFVSTARTVAGRLGLVSDPKSVLPCNGKISRPDWFKLIRFATGNLLQTQNGSVHGDLPTGLSLGADRKRICAWTNRRDCRRSTAESAALFFHARSSWLEQIVLDLGVFDSVAGPYGSAPRTDRGSRRTARTKPSYPDMIAKCGAQL